MVKIGRQKNRLNTLVSPAPVGWRTLAEKVYYTDGTDRDIYVTYQTSCFGTMVHFVSNSQYTDWK